MKRAQSAVIGAAAAVAAMGMAVGQAAASASSFAAVAPRAIEAPKPSIHVEKANRGNRKLRQRLGRRQRRRMAAAEAALAARRAHIGLRRRRSDEETMLWAAIEQMTNWQRNQWSRHCGQDARKRRDVETAQRFAALLRPPRRRGVRAGLIVGIAMGIAAGDLTLVEGEQ